MYYEINVSRMVQWQGGRRAYEHFFATAPRSCTDSEHAAKVAQALRQAFPEPLFKVEVTEYQTLGTRVDL